MSLRRMCEVGLFIVISLLASSAIAGDNPAGPFAFGKLPGRLPGFSHKADWRVRKAPKPSSAKGKAVTEDR